MPISNYFTSVFTKDWEINLTQCMPNGSLKYTDLCNILQLTAAKHSEMGGISFTDMQEFHQAWVLSKMRVEIIDLPKWKDIVTVKTWIISLENSRSVRAFEMVVNGQKKVGSETFWAVFNTRIRRPEALALPHAHFEKNAEHHATSKRVRKITLPQDMPTVNVLKVVLSDLDIVNHVNNVKYLEWCLDVVDHQLLLGQKMKSFDMNFTKELVLGDAVDLLEFKTDKNSFYSVIKEKQSCFALEINWI